MRGRTTRTVPRRRRTRAWRVLRARFVERGATRRPGAGCARRAATRQWAAASTRRARRVLVGDTVSLAVEAGTAVGFALPAASL